MTEVEERIFCGDYSGGCIHKLVVKMKTHLPFSKEFGILCLENRVVIDHVV